nr:PREDICTED: UDP-glucuronosyltransferase 2B31-like [Bemisia tabaci]
MRKIILALLILGPCINAYKILILFPSPLHSHQLPINALIEALVAKGHSVFAVTPNFIPGLGSNYTHVDASFTYKYLREKAKELSDSDVVKEVSKWDNVPGVRLISECAKRQYLSEQFLQFQQQLKRDNIQFDVIIVESCFLPYGCAVRRVLGQERAPLITLSTVSGPDLFGEGHMGSILHGSFSPYLLNGYTDRMSLWQRLENWVSSSILTWQFRVAMEDSVRDYVREATGRPATQADVDCWRDVSLAFLASNSLYYYPRLLAPNTIEVGPLHIRPLEKLPQDIQSWLDGAEKGVVYFSLGTNVLSSRLHKDNVANFLRAFKELPAGYRVLWKWENGTRIAGQPDNVMIQNWLPQQSVLAHPNVKAFITQGGCQSFQETVHFGVPTIGIPWGSDQKMNVLKMVGVGIGVKLDPVELYSDRKIKTAIKTVLLNDSYMHNMKKYSAISRDFTSQAKDKTIFWIEHVARHGGASHLRPATADTTFFHFFCLDIIAAILATAVLSVYTIIIIYKRLFNRS